MKHTEKVDPEISDAMKKELVRQQNSIELIASENFVSSAVLEAVGSVLTNKYSEGYPNRRYYGGNEFIDVCETLAMERAKTLFSAEHANVQPHSGSQANMAAYFALTDWCKGGNKLLGMGLSHGGHLTHGSPVSFSGKFFEVFSYSVDKNTYLIDYDGIRKMAKETKPNILISGASAYPRKIDFKIFSEIAAETGAYHVSDIAHIAGLVVAGMHQSPVPYADVVTTTTHKTLRGPRGAIILCKKEYAEIIDKAVFPGIQGGPLDHTIAAKAVAFKEAMQPDFANYQKQIIKNAKRLAETLIENGMTLITGGTDNHLMLLDVTKINLSGKQAEDILNSVGIVVNKNTIPYDTRKPSDPSGIRLGTPAITTRGMKEDEMSEIGKMISDVLKNPNDNSIKNEVKEKVKDLCRLFAIYQEISD
jgi:glycine hydroxymethyltransferase